MINRITLPLVSGFYEGTRKASMVLQCINLGKVRFDFSVFIDSTETKKLLPVLVSTFGKSQHNNKETQTQKN